MAKTDLGPQPMIEGITKAIEAEAERLREKVIADAVALFEADLRERIAVTAVRLENYYRIDRQDENLIITVRHGGPDGKLPRH